MFSGRLPRQDPDIKKEREPVIRNGVQARDWFFLTKEKLIIRIQTKCKIRLNSRPLSLAYSSSLPSFFSNSTLSFLWGTTPPKLLVTVLQLGFHPPAGRIARFLNGTAGTYISKLFLVYLKFKFICYWGRIARENTGTSGGIDQIEHISGDGDWFI